MSESGKLGARVRKWRENQEKSYEDLAEMTGLSVDFLETLEKTSLCPSIGPLQKIARALGTRLGTFMDDQSTKDPIITRAEERHEDLSMQQAGSNRPSYTYFSLAKGKVDRAMEPFVINMQPETTAKQGLSSHQGEELIFVLEGAVQLIYGQESYVLEKGDTVYYNSAVPHYLGPAKGEPAQIYAVLFYPE